MRKVKDTEKKRDGFQSNFLEYQRQGVNQVSKTQMKQVHFEDTNTILKKKKLKRY